MCRQLAEAQDGEGTPHQVFSPGTQETYFPIPANRETPVSFNPLFLWTIFGLSKTYPSFGKE